MNIHNFTINLRKTTSQSATTEKGQSYTEDSIKKAVEEFNRQCPKKGHKLNREHIQKEGKTTHITHKLTYDNGIITAEIELYDNSLKDATMKPILITPLTFKSGAISDIIQIKNILLE